MDHERENERKTISLDMKERSMWRMWSVEITVVKPIRDASSDARVDLPHLRAPDSANVSETTEMEREERKRRET
jgi:hypothetical protein